MEIESLGVDFHLSPIFEVMQLNYLVVNMTSSGNLVKEIITQAQKAARVAGCLDDLV